MSAIDEEVTSVPRRPVDEKGRYIAIDCCLCGAGELKYQGRGFWSCNGLLDPEDVNKELEACPMGHYDREPKWDINEFRKAAV